MKKMNLFIFVVLLFCTSPLLAQFGVHAGATFSSLKLEYNDDGDTYEDKYDTRTGFTGGVFYRKQLGGVLAIQPELNWIQKGGEQSLSEGESNYDLSIILNYLEVPVYLMYSGGNSSGFFAGVGPAFNFGMSGKLKASLDGEEEEDINFGNSEDDYFKGFHMAINGIAGYQLANGINFNAIISQSITNSAPDNMDDSKAKMFNFGLRVGYMIGGGEEARNTMSKLKRVF